MTPEIPDALPVLVVEPVQEARPWGPWATIGWSVVVMIVALIAQIVGLIGLGIVMGVTGAQINPETIATDGNFLAVGACASGLAATGLSIFFAAVRKGMTVKEYLNLRWPRAKDFRYRWYKRYHPLPVKAIQ